MVRMKCFGGAKPPAGLAEDLAPLNAIKPADLGQLAALVTDHLRNLHAAKLMDAVAAFAAKLNIKNHAVMEAGVRGLVALLQACAHHDASSDDLKHDAQALGLDEGHASAIERAFFAPVDATDFAALLDGATLSQLVDLEWKFGVTCASSASDKPVGKTFLQLKLVLENHEHNRHHLYLELSLPQFYDFLAHMEQARGALLASKAK